jgi:alpha-L-rhamnosidase
MINQIKTLIASCIFTLSAITGFAQNASIIPKSLACELIKEPVGIDVEAPVLSYILGTETNGRGLKQTAYQIIVSGTLDALNANRGDLWESGKVLSDQMGQINYRGRPLKSSRKYWWKVRVWDQAGNVSAWSKPSNWTMGILTPAEWTAKWISAKGAEKYAIKYTSARQDFDLKRDLKEYYKADRPGPNDPNYSSMLFRKEFEISPKLKRAVVHICGLGQYELNINGKKVGDYLLAPGWTDYRKKALYDSYDVTNQLTAGKNAIGIILSNGMYNIQFDSVRYVKLLGSYGPLKAKLQLSMEYLDGTIKTMGTDESWSVSPGPITYMNEYGGEDFDARLDEKGWDKVAFKGSNRWTNSIVLPNETEVVLKGLSCAASPIKAIETLKPVKKTLLKPNVWVYDLGQNASIMPELKVKGTKGSVVRMTPSECIYPNGSIDRRSATQHLGGTAWWQYTLVGDGNEYYFPKFFYQGGRYLQVELFPAVGENKVPEIIELNGIVVHTSADSIGKFSCSNDLFNRIYSLVRWAQRSNLMSIITDCPTREKMSWLEQYHLNGPSLRYNFDLLPLYRKGMGDMADVQYENGLITNIAPELFYAGSGTVSKDKSGNNYFAGDPIGAGIHNSPEWGSAFIIVPWQQYLFSGDKSLIERYFDKMKKYMNFLDDWSKKDILYFGLGDWYDMGPKNPWGSQLTPIEFTATAIYFYDYKVMAQMATTIGKNEDAKRFTEKAEIIRKAFNDKFYNAEKGIYSTGSNTAMAMPLALNIADEKNRKTVAAKLASDIKAHENSFTSGDVGFRFLLKALAMEGYSDLIYTMNNQSDKPGYGYQLKMGATALTEKWNADRGIFGSQNHFMLGQINEWFFHDLAGIGVAEDGSGAGFKHAIIKPILAGDLKWVKGSYKTVNGLISTAWNREKDLFELDLSIPVNTEATVYIPTNNEASVKESGILAPKAKGIKFIKFENGFAIYIVGSGIYHFDSKIAVKN